MPRVAVVLDPIFKKVGLSGKSVIPFVITIGCAVPGIMASRTIRNERERRATAMLSPFMPCGAKIPVIALFALQKSGFPATCLSIQHQSYHRCFCLSSKLSGNSCGSGPEQK